MIANFVSWVIDHPRQAAGAVLTLWGYAVIAVAGVCWRWRVWEADQ